jgi:protein SCO1/2
MKTQTLRRWVAGVLAVSAAALLLACSDQAAPGFNGVDITGADYAKDFALTDQNGQLRTLKDFQGKAVVMFFGYTQCPDVCPTSMTELAAARKLLGEQGDKVQGLFVSIDPARDTPQVMKAYIESFDPTFLALYAATPAQLAALAQDYKVYYKKVEGKTPGSYTMDHSAGLYVYDPQGRLRLYMRYGMGAGPLVDDLRRLLNGK